MGILYEATKRAAVDFHRDDCTVTGAALSYYTIFSLPPLLVLVFMVAQAAGVDRTTIDDIVARQIGLPTGRAEAGEKSNLVAVAERTHDEGGGLLGRVLGFGILVFSATGVLAQLQLALNRAWEVAPDESRGGLWAFARKRLLSLGMIVVFALLLLVSLVLTTLVDEFTRWFSGDAAGLAYVVTSLANVVLSVLLASVLFAAVFKVLPDVDLTWRHVWVGAAVTGSLFVLGKSLIAIYLQRSNVGSQWGAAAGSMIGVLVWVYYNALLVLFGAEFTQAWSQLRGSWPRAEDGARATVDEAVLEERNQPGEAADFRPAETAVGASPAPPATLQDARDSAEDTSNGGHPPTDSESIGTPNAEMGVVPPTTPSTGDSTATPARIESNARTIPPEALPMSNHDRGQITAEDCVFFKLQMTNLTGNPQETLADVLVVLENTLQQCTQFSPDAIVGEHLDQFDDALRAYVEEFHDQSLDFGELCDVIGDDVARCRDLIDRTNSSMRLIELGSGELAAELEPEEGRLVQGDDVGLVRASTEIPPAPPG